MSRTTKIRPDPVMLELRLSQVRELISRLSPVHSDLGGAHIGWAKCKCELAYVLRSYSNAIAKHLGLTPYRNNSVTEDVKEPKK